MSERKEEMQCSGAPRGHKAGEGDDDVQKRRRVPLIDPGHSANGEPFSCRVRYAEPRRGSRGERGDRGGGGMLAYSAGLPPPRTGSRPRFRALVAYYKPGKRPPLAD